jgi:hypothetical protein
LVTADEYDVMVWRDVHGILRATRVCPFARPGGGIQRVDASTFATDVDLTIGRGEAVVRAGAIG